MDIRDLFYDIKETIFISDMAANELLSLAPPTPTAIGKRLYRKRLKAEETANLNITALKKQCFWFCLVKSGYTSNNKK